MMYPKVSICMPVYNGGSYFRAALESALAQTYENVEIVVVNDGSTDGGETERIALARGDRVTYVHQPNRGVAGALNTALEHMTGDYFAWLSHDDLHVPHKTRSQIDFLGRIGRPDACLFSDYDLIGPADEAITTVRLPADRIRKNPRLPLYNGMINGCTLLMPAAIIRGFGPFDETRRCTQDYDLWNRILAEHEFFHQPDVLVRYRIHPGQGSHTPVAVSEGNILWKEMLDSRNEVERAQMFGSTRCYFSNLEKFLDQTPYNEAAAYAHERAAESTAGILISVVIPVWNEIGLAVKAVRSALDQSHRLVEVIVVDDGSTEDLTPLRALAESDPRLKLLHQENAGPAAARNCALLEVQGEYIAFLDADDLFLPHKIERQLDLMQRYGALFSHTSHYVQYHGRQGLGLVRSGGFDLDYPDIIEFCPIAMPTVMLHRAVIDEGHTFPVENRLGEDVLIWTDLAMRYSPLCIDEPLSIVEWSDGSAALNQAKQLAGLQACIEALRNHPIHRRYDSLIQQLEQSCVTLSQILVAEQDGILDAQRLRHKLVNAAYRSIEGFSEPGNWRAEAKSLRTRGHKYFKDRLAHAVVVDETYYCAMHPDVAVAIAAGQFSSAQEHFETHGFREGRTPHKGWSMPSGTW